MKKLFIVAACLCVSFLQNAMASADSEALQKTLAAIKVINAQFEQKVFNVDGQLIQESSGTLTIQRPGQFHWLVEQPDEELIVSNGKEMWLYSPFIEQVTIMNVSDATEGTPFALLSGSDTTKWQDFNVTKEKNTYQVTNKDPQMSSNTFTFTFDGSQQITSFVITEEQGQKSEFILKLKDNKTAFPAEFFEFSIPAGTEIDDQR